MQIQSGLTAGKPQVA